MSKQSSENGAFYSPIRSTSSQPELSESLVRVELRTGDLAIYFQHGAFIPSAARFVRVLEDVGEEQKIVRVYTGPLEIVSQAVHAKYLLPLPESVREEIYMRGPSHQHIRDPIAEWFSGVRRSLLDKYECHPILAFFSSH